MAWLHKARNPAGAAPSRAPIGRMRPDPSHWAVQRGLRGAWLPGRGVPYNIVTGERAVASGVPRNGVGPRGPGWLGATTDSNTATAWTVRDGAILAGLPEWTIIAEVAVDAAIALRGGAVAIYCERGVSGSSGQDILKLTFGNGFSTGFGATYRNDAGTLINTSQGGGYNDAKPRVAAMTLTAGSAAVREYLDGVLTGNSAWGTNNTLAVDAPLRCQIGNDPTALNAEFGGYIWFVAVFGCAFSDAEHAALARDPYCFLLPEG
jgi:hypothetical protein